MIYNLYKNRGETPLQCIERFFEKNPEILKEKTFGKARDKACYLGRLDPLAEGVLLVATGKDIKRKEEFLNLDKDYEFSCIFGFATDTYDIMGKILEAKEVGEINEIDLIKICKIYEGEREQEYPLYSSKYLSANKIPPQYKSIKIYAMKFKGLKKISAKELFGRLLTDISRVKGDFRQIEILEEWQRKLLGDLPSSRQTEGWVGSFSASVSSGTYIRGIVNDIGKTLGIGATTLSIKRTRVGEHKVDNSLRF